MLLHETSDELRLEVSSLQTRGGQQRLGEELAQVASKPHAERDTEPLFAPIHEILWKQARGDFFQHVRPPPRPRRAGAERACTDRTRPRAGAANTGRIRRTAHRLRRPKAPR